MRANARFGRAAVAVAALSQLPVTSVYLALDEVRPAYLTIRSMITDCKSSTLSLYVILMSGGPKSTSKLYVTSR
jgi:hypothetical protein